MLAVLATTGTTVELIRFELRIGEGEPDETIAVDDDGTVVHTISGASTGAGEVGWWRGSVDEGTLELIRGHRGSPVPAGPASVPSVAGDWWAVLDDVPRPTASDGALAALRSSCARAATEPDTVLRADGWTETWDGEPEAVILLRLQGAGSTAADVRFDDPPDAPVAAFVTDEMETLGFLGSTFTIAPPVEATAVVRGRPAVGGRLSLSGWIGPVADVTAESIVLPGSESSSRAGGSPMAFRLVVRIADGPPDSPVSDSDDELDAGQP